MEIKHQAGFTYVCGLAVGRNDNPGQKVPGLIEAGFEGSTFKNFDNQKIKKLEDIMKEENKNNAVVLNLKDAITEVSGPNGLTYVLWPTPIPIYPGQFKTIKWTPGERYSFLNGGYYIVGDPAFRVFQVSAGYAPNGEGFGLTLYNDDAQEVLVQIWFIAFQNE